MACRPFRNTFASRLHHHVRTIIHTCERYGIDVVSIRCSKSRHGVHFYIRIKPSIEAEIANNLQYLLGDDAKRVAFNKARIQSSIAEWNKLFERAGTKPTTIYRKCSVKGRNMAIESPPTVNQPLLATLLQPQKQPLRNQQFQANDEARSSCRSSLLWKTNLQRSLPFPPVLSLSLGH